MRSFSWYNKPMLSKLNEEQYTKLRRMSQDGVPNNKLCEIFGVSLSTVERYKHESVRELSRTIVRDKPKPESTCYRCGMLIPGHPRCTRCEILTHNNLGECDSCLSRPLH